MTTNQKSDFDELKKEMLKQAPYMADDYADYIRSQFKIITDKFGPTLKGIKSVSSSKKPGKAKVAQPVPDVAIGGARLV